MSRAVARVLPSPVGVTRALPGSQHFVIPDIPRAKPRQTRSDKWKKRPAVLRYRAWADIARAAAPLDLSDRAVIAAGIGLGARFYLPMPKSWQPEKRDELRGKPHLCKPDLGNLMKALEDALFPEDDSAVWKYIGEPEKLWDDGGGPRTVVIWTTRKEPYGEATEPSALH